MKTLRVVVPGGDASSSDIADFAVYADEDNVLVKEQLRGGATIGVNNGSPSYEITHNLGYIPFHVVYALDPVTGKWEVVPHFQTAVTVPKYAALCDATKLYIANFYQSTVFKWIIFYDNIVGASANNLTFGPGLRVAKQGINAATNTDPNNFIFHSDFNTLKILKEAAVNITSSGAGSYAFNHNSPANKVTAFLVYCKFPDGTTAFIPGGFGVVSKNVTTQYVSDLAITPTQFTFSLGSVGVYKFYYFIFEIPLGDNYDWTPQAPITGIVIAKPGYNASTEQHPDHLKFTSRFNTLKYFTAGYQAVTCAGNNEDKTVEVAIANPLHYPYLYVAYVDNIFSGNSGRYAFTPHTSNTIATAHEAAVYIDQYSLYFKLRIKEAGAFSYTAHFYYKLFKNALTL